MTQIQPDFAAIGNLRWQIHKKCLREGQLRSDSDGMGSIHSCRLKSKKLGLSVGQIELKPRAALEVVCIRKLVGIRKSPSLRWAVEIELISFRP